MKSYIKILIIMLFGVIAHAQQSSIVFDSGTNIDVGIGADISAGTITVNGTYSGGGTFNNGPLPVELTSFTASVLESKVILNWQTATEVNNYGFEVERTSPRPSPQGEGGEAGRGWEKIGFVQGHGNSNSVKEYLFVDGNVSNGKVSYRLKQIDNDGKYEYSKEIEVDLITPNEFSLSQNYPNPFNPSTTIKFGLPKTSNVKLELFNILGEKIETLIDKEMEAGYHNYQLSIVNYQLTSGVYFYKIEAGSFSSVKKLLLMK